MSWFERLFGFHERDGDVHKQITVNGTTMTSRVNGNSYTCGTFETPSLAELRARGAQNKVMERVAGTLKVSIAIGDVSSFIAKDENRYALFQAASQFNCLEFPGPSVLPEHGVTNYVGDRTQGPACSVACGPGTVYRNYFVPLPLPPPLLIKFDASAETTPQQEGAETKAEQETKQVKEQEQGKEQQGKEQQQAKEEAKEVQAKEVEEPRIQLGQSRDLQIDNLSEVSKLVGNEPNGRFYTMKGGYTLATTAGMKLLNKRLRQLDADSVMEKLRVGVHSDTQVTSTKWGSQQIRDPEHLVTEVFGSACSVAYSYDSETSLWEPFATLILNASYECTLWAALENACRHPNDPSARVVYLTALGGGVFGNPMEWIADAMRRAFRKFQNTALDVRIVIYRYPEPELSALEREFQQPPTPETTTTTAPTSQSTDENKRETKTEEPEAVQAAESTDLSTGSQKTAESTVGFCPHTECWLKLPCPTHPE